MAWKPAESIGLYFQARDSRTTSDNRPQTDVDTLDLQQGYVRLGREKGDGWSMILGRQELVYGDQRYIGNSDWSAFGRTFDGVKATYRRGTTQIDAIALRPVLIRDKHFNRSNDYDRLSGLHAATRWLPKHELELYFFARNVLPGSPTAITPTLGGPGARDIYFAGVRAKNVRAKDNPWDYAWEFTDQFGSLSQSGVRRDHRAWTLSASAGYTWKAAPGSPRLALGYDHGTGDDRPGDGVNKTAEMLFGTNHKAYGNMDLTGIRNTRIPRLELSAKPTATLTASMDWLGFWRNEGNDYFYPESAGARTQNGYGRNPGNGSYLGHEIDLLVDWKFMPGYELRFGYARFFPGTFVRRSLDAVPANGGHGEAQWAFVQVAFNF